MPGIAERWREVVARVERACRRAGRDPHGLRIVAVSKTFPPAAVREAYSAGARLFGENYVQEALPKIDALADLPQAEWHFVGALQSNKAKQVVGRFSLLHSVDRMSLAAELEKTSRKTGAPVRGLIEVNIAGEGTKHGVEPAGLTDLARRISGETSIEIAGLMVFPPPAEDPEAVRPHFRRGRELAVALDRLNLPRISGGTLSMGITGDFEVAIEEGATLVRIGTAIFGPRHA